MRISKEHGLNPSINVCFFCGKDKEIKLFGKLKGDAKAPKRILADYHPCKECADKFADNCLVIEVVTTDTGSIPIVQGAWPTGRWCVISKAAAKKLFKNVTVWPILLEEPLYNALMEHRRNVQ